MRGEDRALRDVHDVRERLVTHVRDVDDHAEPVHLSDDPPPDRRQTTVRVVSGGRVSERVVRGPGDREVAIAERVQLAKAGQGELGVVGAERLCALDPHQDRGASSARGGFDLVRGGAEGGDVGVVFGQLSNGGGQRQRPLPRDLSFILVGVHEDAKKRAAQAALTHPRKIQVTPFHPRRDVVAIEHPLRGIDVGVDRDDLLWDLRAVFGRGRRFFWDSGLVGGGEGLRDVCRRRGCRRRGPLAIAAEHRRRGHDEERTESAPPAGEHHGDRYETQRRVASAG